jgi:single-strand DNA-binding protein
MAKYGLNRVTLIGNLGHDPELKYLDQGIAYTTIRIACTDRVRDKEGNYRDRTEWVSVNLWRGQAEIVAKYCKKGSTICVEGRLRNHSWETPAGEKRSRIEVEGQQIILLDGRPVGGDNSFTKPVSQVNQGTGLDRLTAAPATRTSSKPAAIQQGDDESKVDDLPF